MKERWICYGTGKMPTGVYEVIKVLQDCSGTEIVIESEEHRVVIKFGFVDALRVSDEGRRIRTYNEITEVQNYRKDFNGIPLYKVLNSEFYRWVVKESVGFYEDFTHYTIITKNDIIDVISSYPPELLVENL